MERVRTHPQRLVVKVGSSSIINREGQLAVVRLQSIIHQLVTLQTTAGWELVMVSSGALAVGINRLGWQERCLTKSEKQAAAAVGQTVLMHTYEQLFQQEDVQIGQLLLTKSDMATESGRRGVRRALCTLLQSGVLPILNENDTVADDGRRLGNNDTLASLISVLVNAQQLVLLTDTTGLHDADPHQNQHAMLISDVWEVTEEIVRIAGEPATMVGTGGMRTKVEAARFATSAGTTVIVASSEIDDVLLRIVNNEAVGTCFHARSNTATMEDLDTAMATYDVAALESFWQALIGG